MIKKLMLCILTVVTTFGLTTIQNVKAKGQPITVSVSKDTIYIAVDIADSGDAQSMLMMRMLIFLLIL